MSSIGVGLVGAGWMGATLLKRLTEQEEVSIVGVHQRRRDRAVEVLTELGLSEDLYFRDYESMLSSPALDAVFICSTNEAHGLQAIAALKAGKHVFCEKPCATRYDDFLQQIELERANPGQVTFVDYLMNFDALENRIRRMTSEGVFGDYYGRFKSTTGIPSTSQMTRCGSFRREDGRCDWNGHYSFALGDVEHHGRAKGYPGAGLCHE